MYIMRLLDPYCFAFYLKTVYYAFLILYKEPLLTITLHVFHYFLKIIKQTLIYEDTNLFR